MSLLMPSGMSFGPGPASQGGAAAKGIGGLLRDIFALKKDELTSAEQLASWLPYRSWIEADQIVVTRDGMGFVVEITPQSGADDSMVEVLGSLYAGCPPNTGVQFHLFGSPHVHPILRDYANLRREDPDQADKALPYGRVARNENLFRKLARARVAHMRRSTHRSMTQGFPYFLRDFRLLMSVVVDRAPDNLAEREALMTLREAMQSTLKAAGFPSRVCHASDLISWCSMFTNPDQISAPEARSLFYDPGREVCDQIVDFDTVQDAEPQGLRLWKAAGSELSVRFYSIRSFPPSFPLWQMGALIGDLMQSALQYPVPFLLTMGVQILDPVATKQIVITNHLRATQNAGSPMAKLMPDVVKKLDDWSQTADDMDAGGGLVSMCHELALFGEPHRMIAAEQAAKAIWRARGFELASDMYMHRQSLLASLPLTLSPAFHRDMERMRRVTRKRVANAIHLAPLVAEWRGTKTPVMVLGGRRGQIMVADLYDNDGNYNFAAIGAPGSGKSVLLNEIAWSYLGVGGKVWMLDLGRSFEKLCRKAGGEHIVFGPSSQICLNPFSVVKDECIGENGPEGGINEDIDMLTPAIAIMCSPQRTLEGVQYKAIQAMILRKFKEYGPELTITGLRDAFVTGTIEELGLRDDQRIRDLAVMLNPFSRDGQYGRFFEGRNNVDLGNDFIVIENEELKRKPDLHAVVNVLLLFQITGEMYLTRNRKKVLIIDELKQQLQSVAGDDPVLVAVIEEAARRARKYGGALGTATQSADDYYGSAQMEAALNCSDWMFLLRQKPESIELLAEKKRLSMNDAQRRLLHSLRTEPGVFSEMFVTSPVGSGVARLILDPATHLLFSNRLEDNAPLDALLARGYTIDQAIEIVLRERGELPC